MKRTLFILSFLFFCASGFCQQPDTSNVIYLPAKVINGDTIIVTNLNEVVVGDRQQRFASRFEEKKYWKLVYNLKKVLPYAKMARSKLDEMNAHFLTLKTEREKRQYTKQVEQQMKAEFEDQLKALTITQGRLLIKLIYRETGNTSYELVKDLRGGMSAMFWQTLARLFGSNLKSKYDPLGEDAVIEDIVVAIENGMI